MKVEELSPLLKKYNISTDFNNSTEFLTPLILHNINTNKEVPMTYLKKFGFINIYIDDFGLDSEIFEWKKSKDPHLFMLFQPNYSDEFLKTEMLFKSFAKWVDYYDLDEEGQLVVHVFKVVDSFKEDFINFVNSNYSKLSENLQSLYNRKYILDIIQRTEEGKKLQSEKYGIDFNQYPDVELLSKIDLSKEILRYE